MQISEKAKEINIRIDEMDKKLTEIRNFAIESDGKEAEDDVSNSFYMS